ncbi:hypothetical protein FA09DRAFT_329777 [Tilletiopsis washingtonensis]|uniref:Blue (type 1) copper domain-containing protein n=1 Tax=Tilletiopsis washingtonensis TaxID=58919 RepID=A0A316Z973_9BASI|nr:hypothetical protein FA09DRAFT_329777 [Tilletiopsis washingtonensis]PWN98149.1 hypothetical protein FA09DRAFT_329777 [Tilletiopsis washingtonensis]
MFFRAPLILAALAACVSAANITVQVGQGGDKFSPTSVTAAQGDTISFVFHENMEHNVIEAQGTDTATACQPKEGALHSALQNEAAVVSVPVNSTDPVYIFCGPHCESKGMVFIINPGTVSVEQYAAAAKGQSSSSSSAASSGSSTAAASSSTRAASSSAAGAASSSSGSSAPAATSARTGAAQVAKPVLGAGVAGVLLAALLA